MSDTIVLPEGWVIWFIPHGIRGTAMRRFSSESFAKSAFDGIRETLMADPEIDAAGLMGPGSTVFPGAGIGKDGELDEADVQRIRDIMARYGL